MRLRSLRSWTARALTAITFVAALVVVAGAGPARAAECTGSTQIMDQGGAASGDCPHDAPGGSTPVSTGGSSGAEACQANGQTGTVSYRDDGPVDPDSQVGNPNGGDGSIGIPYGTDAHWYFRFCVLPDGTQVALGSVVLPVGAGGAAIDPTVLRDAARAQIQVSAPVFHMAPNGSEKAPAIVHMSVWAWMDPTYWQPVTATDAEGGLSVSVIAKPTRSEWTMGDKPYRDATAHNGTGHLTCSTAGRPWINGLGDDAKSDCEYTYVQDSSLERDGLYHGTVTATWQLSWTLNGADQGTFATVTSPPTAFTMKVGEIQVVNGPAPPATR